MEQQQNMLTPNSNGGLQSLPNATASLVLGIISIVGIWCYGVVGLICGIIGLVLANKDRALYKAYPEMYSPGSISTSNAGRTCSIIGLILSSCVLLGIIIFLAVIGHLIGHQFPFHDLQH